MAHLQRAPLLSANEEYMEVVGWEKEENQKVKKGETICILETSKAAVEVESKYDGFLFPLVRVNEKIKVGEAIAIIKDSLNEDITEILEKIELEKEKKGKQSTERSRGWTKKAEILAKKHGIDISKIPAVGIIREADVETYIKLGKTGPVNDLIEDVYPGNLQERVLIIGGGRGAVQVIDTICRQRKHKIVGILDDNKELRGKKIMGYSVLGSTKEAKKLWSERKFDCLIISFSNDLFARAKIFEKYHSLGIPFTNVIDPTVILHSNVSIGKGNVIMANCRVGPCAIIGNNNFLSAYVNIEHHNEIGNHCTFGPGVMTSSRVRIGDRVKFGTGIFIEPGIKIGEDTIVASGSILTANVPSKSAVKVTVTYKIRSRNF